MKKMSKNVLLVLGVLVAFTIDVAAEAVISSGAVSYSNTTVSAALDELFSAVDINNKIGTTDISSIGDGTITGAIGKVNSNYNSLSTRTRESLNLLGIYPYTSSYTTSSATNASGTISITLSAKEIFGFSSVPSNFIVVAGTSRATSMSISVSHTIGEDEIRVVFRNVSGGSIAATTLWYSIIGMCV